jgi:hypothetical protein
MQKDFYFWASIVSLIINIILILLSVGLAVANRKEKERRNSQVKIWMQDAQGISEGIQRIINNRWQGLYSSVKDVVNSVHVLGAPANSLFQSLYEERTMTEEEYKEEQKRYRDLQAAQLQQNIATTSEAAAEE